MSLYVVNVEIKHKDVSLASRIVGPYKSEAGAQRVAELIRGRAYTRLVKNRRLLGQTGEHPEMKVAANVRVLHNEAAKYQYDWAEDNVLHILGVR